MLAVLNTNFSLCLYTKAHSHYPLMCSVVPCLCVHMHVHRNSFYGRHYIYIYIAATMYSTASFFFFFSLRACSSWKAETTRKIIHMAAAGHTVNQSFWVCKNQCVWGRWGEGVGGGRVCKIAFFAHGKIICLFSVGVCIRHPNEPWPPPILWLGQQIHWHKRTT